MFCAIVGLSTSECPMPPLLGVLIFPFVVLTIYHLHHYIADMDLKGKIALFPFLKSTVDIVDIAIGRVVQQHDVEGEIDGSASVQKNIAAMAVSDPYHGVHVIDLASGKVLLKFILPDGEDVSVALSRDTLTLAVGSDTGMS
jgi:hypothetical protein